MSSSRPQKLVVIIPPSEFLLDDQVFPYLGPVQIATAARELAGWDVEVLDLTGHARRCRAVCKQFDARTVHVDDGGAESARGALRGAVSEQPAAYHDKPECEAEVWAYAQARIAETQADVWGFYALSAQVHTAVRLHGLVREVHGRGATTVLGGPHVAMAPEGAAALGFDHVVADLGGGGGGEAPFLRLLGALRAGICPPRVLRAQPGEAALHRWPWPDRGLIDIGAYEYLLGGNKTATIVTQRGCPYACTFCSHTAHYRKIEYRDRRHVKLELDELRRRWDYHAVMCYDDQTDILVEGRGFVRFSEMTSTDRVAALDPTSGRVRFETPTRSIRKTYKGDLITVRSRFVDLAVTPEHRMWLAADLSAPFDHVRADLMAAGGREVRFQQEAAWVGHTPARMHIPAYETKYLGQGRGSPKVQEGLRSFDTRTWLRFLAWYLAEGSSYNPIISNGGVGYRICIKQSRSANPGHVEEIGETITALGYNWSYSNDQFHIDSKELFQYLHPIGTSKVKRVPEEVQRLSPALLDEFLLTYAKGDGHTSPTGQITITSFSEGMRDDLQEIAIKAGRWAALDNRNRVLISQQRRARIAPDDMGAETYDGEVFCVTVSTGVVLVRRNGKAVWCGNCYDDEVNINPKHFAALCDVLGADDWTWRAFIKSNLFTPEQAAQAASSGAVQLCTGAESASPEIKKHILKKSTVNDDTRFVRLCLDNGIQPKLFSMLGLAGETRETAWALGEWLTGLVAEGLTDFDITVFTPYPGTPIYDALMKDGVYIAPGGAHGMRLVVTPDFAGSTVHYKGRPGEYQCMVETFDPRSGETLLTAPQIVQLREEIDAAVRAEVTRRAGREAGRVHDEG